MQLGVRAAVAVCRLAAVAPIQPLAWEFTYAVGMAVKRQKKKKKKKKIYRSPLYPVRWHVDSLARHERDFVKLGPEPSSDSPKHIPC